jgi:hypothetical protein
VSGTSRLHATLSAVRACCRGWLQRPTTVVRWVAVMTLDLDSRYTVDGFSDGIAFYLLGPVMTRDEDYYWTGIEEAHETLVRVVMVGDDRVFEVDRDDLTKLGELDYCAECGQVGCTADGRERE